MIRGQTPFGSALLAPGADPAAALVGASEQITQVDLAPSGEAAAIVSRGSEAGVSFRPAGAASGFDAPRWLDRAGQQRSYGVGITPDPDGGVFVVYRTEQNAALLQAYAPPGGDFGPPQLVTDVPATALSYSNYPQYAQSSDGHGLLTWSENVRGDTNTDLAWALTRQPGGLLGGKSLIADAAPGRLVQATQTGISDDGSVIAVRSGGGDWAKTTLPNSWPNRGDVAAIATAGNAVGVVIQESTDSGARCAESDPSSRVQVRLGQGLSLGAPVTVASEDVTNGGKYGNVVHPQGFAVNASGGAALLADEPTGDGNYSRYLYVNEASGGSGSGGGAGNGSGEGGGEGDKDAGKVGAKLIEDANRTAKAGASASGKRAMSAVDFSVA